MLRIARLCGLIFGLVILLFTATLAHLRHTPVELRWVIFSAAPTNSDNAVLYRVLSDGSHLQYLTDVSLSSLIIVNWERPGWLAIDQQVSRERRLSLVHLNGHQQILLLRPSPTLLADYYRRYYDVERHMLYIIVAAEEESDLWILDLESGKEAFVGMPVKPTNYRSRFVGDSYVFWSDANSSGDLYRFQFASPPTITRLTTRGDISRTSPNITQDGWVYFYIGQTEPPAAVTLYRIRDNGTDEQVVIPEMLLLPEVTTIRSPDPATFYYWGGTFNQPQLMRVNGDGRNPTPLAIPPFDGLVQAWSPDRQWLYYRVPTTDDSAYYAPSDLYRMDVRTGKSFLVLQNQNILQSNWSADGEWLVLLIEDAEEHHWLYRMRPDGSEFARFGLEVREYWREIYPYDHLVFQMSDGQLTLGDAHYFLHILDLNTLEIRRINDGLDPTLNRTVETTAPVPDFDWQPIELAAVGVIVGAVGFMPTRRRKWFSL